jgi:transcriptional regulator with XRE-family HTH domain
MRNPRSACTRRCTHWRYAKPCAIVSAGVAVPAERETFGTLLRRYRLMAGLTQEGLAERAGLSMRGVSDLERGQRRVPYLDTVERLIAALGLGPAEQQALNAARRTSPAASRMKDALTPASMPTVPLTSFVGREHELREIEQILRRARLLTIVGAGGAGRPALSWRRRASWVRISRTESSSSRWRASIPLASSPQLLPLSWGSRYTDLRIRVCSSFAICVTENCSSFSTISSIC